MRRSGILMHISSLPSPYGIGSLGKAAFDFVDFLKKAGQSLWQILPVCPTSVGDSPYQSFSTFAGNPYFIDIDLLIADGLLTRSEAEPLRRADGEIDYAGLYENRRELFKTVYSRFKTNPPEDYAAFCEAERGWLEDYALFTAIKSSQGGKAWHEWEQELKTRKPSALKKAAEGLSEEINICKTQQYLFFRQWEALKKYANKNGVKIVGDLPIYVAADSADVWAFPELFMLDENLAPTVVAGCPPDAFTEDGQLWGNPIYNWQAMKSQDYGWWKKRMAHALRIYDMIRIDHFRGFDSYYVIPAGDKNARGGHWEKGPGAEFFAEMKKSLGRLPVIAEDLGFLTDSVRRMLKKTGFPGMKVLQFAFDPSGESEYLPHNHIKNCVVYTGTHDNDTVLGWLKTAPKKEISFAKKYMRLSAREGLVTGVLRTALASPADTAVLTMQDFLALGSEARINTPGTLGGNWLWRAKSSDITDELAEKIYKETAKYSRLPAGRKARNKK